jgi:predicted membrane protein
MYFAGFYILTQYLESDILFIISLLIFAFILYRIIHALCRFASSIAVAYHCIFPFEEFLRFKRDSSSIDP